MLLIDEAIRLNDEREQLLRTVFHWEARIVDYPAWQQGTRKFIEHRIKFYSECARLKQGRIDLINHILCTPNSEIEMEIAEKKIDLDYLIRRNNNLQLIGETREWIKNATMILIRKEQEAVHHGSSNK